MMNELSRISGAIKYCVVYLGVGVDVSVEGFSRVIKFDWCIDRLDC